MKIKDEYKGMTLMKNTALGNITVVIDNIDVKRYDYYVSIGFGYLFEKETATAPIRYEGIEADEQTDAPVVTKPKRKRPVNAVAKKESKRNRNNDTAI
jgi:dihydropteroate synthase